MFTLPLMVDAAFPAVMEDFEIWDSTGRLAAQSRQLAILPGGA